MNLLLVLGCLLPVSADNAAQPTVARLVKQLDDQKDEMRIEALQELARLGADARSALPAIAAALKVGEVRSYAAKALAELGALDVLAKALEDRDEDVRIEAILALQRFRKKAVPALRGVLKDKSADVKMNTANVLGKIGEE